jgi:ribose-phosphate pyrophosphokinase
MATILGLLREGAPQVLDLSERPEPENTDRRMFIFSGNAHTALAGEICDYLGLDQGRALVTTFRNEETRVRIEENVRGADVFVIQSGCVPVDHSIMELLIMIDALRRASAHRVTAVIPYFPYAKQEKKTAGREPISAKLVANLIRTAGADRVVTLDLHAPAIEGFFDIPVDHLRANPVLADAFRRRMQHDDFVIVSPDSGGVSRANDFRLRVGGHLAIIAKQRPQPDMAEVIEMVGDVRGKTAVIVDDMISTGGTLIEAAETLLERGARDVVALATHGIFAGGATVPIESSRIGQVIVTNTIPLPASAVGGKIQQVSVAPLLAEAIRRIHRHESVSALFT